MHPHPPFKVYPPTIPALRWTGDATRFRMIANGYFIVEEAAWPEQEPDES
jgi:hypothetical protein